MAGPTPESSSEIDVFESEADLCNGESEHATNSAGANLMCPHCRSKKLWRNGYRYTPFDDKIQRWLCCNCGRRFSDPQDVEKAWSTPEHFERVESKSIKSRDDKDNIHQEAKHLIEDGFEYVLEKEGVSLFRKLK